MSILSPVSSAKSLLSPKANGYAELQAVKPTSVLQPPARTPSYASAVGGSNVQKDFLHLTPEELFTKQTVTEIKAVQRRLSADADAKQEELRLMVGERYRDLLQASSSIISIAQSSKRVLEAIEESKRAILLQNDLPLPPKTATGFSLGAEGTITDRHLFSLQALSAHMRVLLDAPEHLWRFIERKRYLQAAWLFLLARVVHRELVSTDDSEESPWAEDGIDVHRDFPLVQRQWDVVSQFRSQIIHKSTLSLRDITTSTEEVCATLVTLHLLDSRPLNETLSTLLQQRSKTLQSVIAWKPEPKPTENGSKVIPNGIAPSMSVRDVTQLMKNTSNAISQTISTARIIFDREVTGRSLIFRVLGSVQYESTKSVPDIPSELQLSTQSLLTQLSSSANFQLLPYEVRSYKPYVDLDSSSASLTQPIFDKKLQEWFIASCEHWKNSAAKWVLSLSTVKDVWNLRTSFKRFLSSSGLNEQEKFLVSSNTDIVLHKRVLEIWHRALGEAEGQFKTRLLSSRAALGIDQLPDPSPADFLFSTPPVPILSQNVKSFADTPFQKYQQGLKQQLVGRSGRLDGIISILEQCARSIQHDLSIMRNAVGEASTAFHDSVAKAYQPTANSLAGNVVNIIGETSKELKEKLEKDTVALVFLARVTDVLHSGSSFSDQIGCGFKESHAFKEELRCINEDILERWRNITIQRLLDEPQFQLNAQLSQTRGPSPALLQALILLAEDLKRLGIVFNPIRHQEVVRDTMGFFVQSVLERSRDTRDEQTNFNLAFLWKISESYGQPWSDTTAKVHQLLLTSVRLFFTTLLSFFDDKLGSKG
ncbi:hypothetical protein CPB83DRAFT_913079 [Crepidotus variabilis]|uniref:Conserved oligomeric Golgi complex subunit 1 n=1 Tax=Crepidotus variabilis TaxID=179855 RepID=A0A9P6EUR6_9AGAR|nr:hypothetical protein CPB83DRAFT_913079 [Crepidotus variabilis]